MRPQYGGTLRIQMRERIATLDPRMWSAGLRPSEAAERVASLIFDRLLRVDARGELEPALAVSWQHDARAKRWEFRLRRDVRFSDGTLLTPSIAALVLQQEVGNDFMVSAGADTVALESDRASPNLPVRLATGSYFIFHAADEGSLSGTGPFRVIEWRAPFTALASGSSTVEFAANETCWAGRPFVDRIELRMGVDAQQQANAVAFNQADVVELPATEVRHSAQRGVRIASVPAEPTTLFLLQFDGTRPAGRDARLREAVSLAVDRTAIADVILQRQAVAAGSLLPNWLSGYAFLFPTRADPARARQLLVDAHREVSRAPRLSLIYDFDDMETRVVAERILVDLQQAGIAAQSAASMTRARSEPIVAGRGATSPRGDLWFVRRRLESPDAGFTLVELLDSLGQANTAANAAGEITSPTPKQTYAAERAALQPFQVIPIAHLSDSYGLSARVRNWFAPHWGSWRLADVWLDPSAALKPATEPATGPASKLPAQGIRP